MFRLCRQPVVRLATHRITQRITQRLQFRGLTNGSGDGGDSFIPGGTPEGEAKQQWAGSNYDRLWDHVNTLDDRVATLSRDLGNFKGDVSKSLGELSTRMEKGFGEVTTKLAAMEAGLKSDFAELKRFTNGRYSQGQQPYLFGLSKTTQNIISLMNSLPEVDFVGGVASVPAAGQKVVAKK